MPQIRKGRRPVANKPKQVERDRRAKVEEMRKAEQARERRKSMLFVRSPSSWASR